MNQPLRVCALSGSLRSASYNTALLRAAVERAPQQDWTWASIDLPLFNADLEADAPVAVARFHEVLRASDVVLIATPEFNYSLPGALKNAIDWASRPSGAAALTLKRVGIIGASTGAVGTARAQAALRQTLFAVRAQLFPHPEFLVSRAHEKFDASGTLTDEATLTFLTKYLDALWAWAS